MTGEYFHRLGRNESTLYVKQETSNRIRFAVKSLWIGDAKAGKVHVGNAAGSIAVQGDKGMYESPEGFKLSFSFAKGRCNIDCDDCSSFGGVNVTPEGLYKRVNLKEPTESDLKAEY